MNPEPNYKALDPGIRQVVQWLRTEFSLATTDSGDGVSKPAVGRVLSVPHVFGVCRDLSQAVHVAHIVWDWLEARGTAKRILKRVRVEVTYSPADQAPLVAVYGLTDALLAQLAAVRTKSSKGGGG